MSMLAMGTVVLFSTSRTDPKGSRTAPLKLKPKMASITRLYASSITAAWGINRFKISMLFVLMHWQTQSFYNHKTATWKHQYTHYSSLCMFTISINPLHNRLIPPQGVIEASSDLNLGFIYHNLMCALSQLGIKCLLVNTLLRSIVFLAVCTALLHNSLSTNLRHLSQEGDLHLLALCGQTLEQRFVWSLRVEDGGLVTLQEDAQRWAKLTATRLNKQVHFDSALTGRLI